MEQSKQSKNKKIKGLFLFLLCLLLLSFFWLVKRKVDEAQAGEQDNVLGWAWSENFGWFSANCANLAECPVPTPPPYDYGLNIGEDGSIVGYLWAEHIGWVKFGGTGAPGGQEAFYDKNTSKIYGWAKILALGDNGWLKLRGSSVSVGVGPYRRCADCKDIKDDEGNLIDIQCRICFKSELYGGSNAICSSCSGCTRGDENICNTCGECDAYGVAVDRDTGRILGWAWNGNLDSNGNLTIGVGWLNFSPTPGGIVLKSPWLETLYGEIYSKNYVRSPSAFVPLLGKYNATFCIEPAGTITHFTSESSCLIEGFEIINYPKTINRYTNVLGKIDLDGILSGQYGTVKEITDESEIESMLGGKIYYHEGDLTVGVKEFLNGVGKQNGAGLILVKGNLNIVGNISYQSGNVSNLKNLSSIGWMVLDDGTGTKGNINIDKSVEEIVGAFYAEGTVSTGTTGDSKTEVPLTVKGLMLARMFKFERMWASAIRGSEQVIYDGRVLANTPPGMTDIVKALPVWREMGP